MPDGPEFAHFFFPCAIASCYLWSSSVRRPSPKKTPRPALPASSVSPMPYCALPFPPNHPQVSFLGAALLSINRRPPEERGEQQHWPNPAARKEAAPGNFSAESAPLLRARASGKQMPRGEERVRAE